VNDGLLENKRLISLGPSFAQIGKLMAAADNLLADHLFRKPPLIIVGA
jgi:hypothetical protein